MNTSSSMPRKSGEQILLFRASSLLLFECMFSRGNLIILSFSALLTVACATNSDLGPNSDKEDRIAGVFTCTAICDDGVTELEYHSCALISTDAEGDGIGLCEDAGAMTQSVSCSAAGATCTLPEDGTPDGGITISDASVFTDDASLPEDAGFQPVPDAQR